MSKIDETDLNICREEDDFINYDNVKALFNTKMASEMKYNGEIVEVIGLFKGRDVFCDRYVVRFNDGIIEDNIMNIELEFDYKKENEKNSKKKDTKNREAR